MKGNNGGMGLFTRIGRIIDEYWPIMLVTASGIAMLFIRDLVSNITVAATGKIQWTNATIVSVVCLAFVTGNLFVYKRTSKANLLKRENEELRAIIQGFGDDYFAIWQTKLGHVARALGLGDQERVSIYRHSSQRRIFYMLGRYSEGPYFARRGRGVYPENEGCIGHAWRTGEGIATELPDPSTEYDEYVQRMIEDWNIDADALEQMEMKSRLICAIAIRDRTDLHRIAVIVFESTRTNGFSLEDIRKFVNGTQGREMAHLIEVLQSLEPSPDMAKSRGF